MDEIIDERLEQKYWFENLDEVDDDNQPDDDGFEL